MTLRARSAPRASPRPHGTPAPAEAVPPSASHRRCHSARLHPPGTRALRASITRLEQETKVGIRKPGLSRAGHVARVPRPRVPRGPPATQGTLSPGTALCHSFLRHPEHGRGTRIAGDPARRPQAGRARTTSDQPRPGGQDRTPLCPVPVNSGEGQPAASPSRASFSLGREPNNNSNCNSNSRDNYH